MDMKQTNDSHLPSVSGKTWTMGQGDRFDVVVVGGGAAGIATAASLLRRRAALRLAIVEPCDTHHYQPGWTMVGAGIFASGETERPMMQVIPHGAKWLRSQALSFDPDGNRADIGGRAGDWLRRPGDRNRVDARLECDPRSRGDAGPQRRHFQLGVTTRK